MPELERLFRRPTRYSAHTRRFLSRASMASMYTHSLALRARIRTATSRGGKPYTHSLALRARIRTATSRRVKPCTHSLALRARIRMTTSRGISYWTFCLSVRAHVREKWRSTAFSWGHRRLDRAGPHRRKVRQAGGLRSSAVGSGHGEMALPTLEKGRF